MTFIVFIDGVDDARNSVRGNHGKTANVEICENRSRDAAKRAADTRNKDFNEIYAEFAAERQKNKEL